MEVFRIFGVYGELTLFLPISQSLKDRRKVLKSIQQRLINALGLSIADASEDGLWQRGRLLFSLVASNATVLEELINEIDRQMSRYEGEAELTGLKYNYINWDDLKEEL